MACSLLVGTWATGDVRVTSTAGVELVVVERTLPLCRPLSRYRGHWRHQPGGMDVEVAAGVAAAELVDACLTSQLLNGGD